MFQSKNIPFACNNEMITIGRMKGNIKPGDKIYKIESKLLSDSAKSSYSGPDIKKIKLNCKVTVKKNTPVSVSIVPNKSEGNYKGLRVDLKSNIIPKVAINQPITKEKIITQFSKTNDTPYEFSNIEVDLDNGLYLPKLSEINALRREVLNKVETLVSRKLERVPAHVKLRNFEDKIHSSPKVSLLLLNINPDFDYTKLENVDRVYIPLRSFRNVKARKAIQDISSRFNLYIYMPTIVNLNDTNILSIFISSFVSMYNIKGFVISNVGELELMKEDKYKNLDFIANYTMNVFNDYTINELSKKYVNTITLSPELSKDDIRNMHSPIDKELIVYGKIKVMTSKYCLLGRSNLCYPTCDSKCKDRNSVYSLRDRMGFSFRILPNDLQSLTNIYNSKTLSITYDDLNIDSVRIDIMDETIDEINNVIRIVKSGNRFEGENYTNGNLNRFV